MSNPLDSAVDQLEYELTISLSHLLDGNFDAARAIIYGLSATNTRIIMVKAVARQVVPEGPELRGFLYLLDKISDLAQQRNEFIHGEFWHADHGGLDLVVIRPIRQEPLQIESVTEGILQTHLETLEHRTNQLYLVNDKHPERNVALILQTAMRRRA